MVQLEELSKIGFGTYNTSPDSKENMEAFRSAIEEGCNLVDTASTYGDSELFIGNYLKEQKKVPLFIVSKAGYMNTDLLEKNKTLVNKLKNEINLDLNEIQHCIHPDFLEKQLYNSLRKLNRKFLDVFLLHNPEKFLIHCKTEQQVNGELIKAFEFLEKMKRKGLIRYYGISSNVIQFSNYANKNLNIKLYLNLLRNISSSGNGFKFIQFPFNLGERDAALPLINNTSLIDIAKEAGLIRLSNRPFSIHAQTYIRIEDSTPHPFCESDTKLYREIFDRLKNRIVSKIYELDPTLNIADFPILFAIENGWDKFANDAAVYEIYDGNFISFIHTVFDDELDEELTALLQQLRAGINLKTKYNMSVYSLHFKNTYYKEKNIKDDGTSFNERACLDYFSNGIDHILVGMTRKKYVQQLKTLFN